MDLMILKSHNISISINHNQYNYYNHNPSYTSISSLVFGNIPQEIWDYLINKTIYVNDITLDYSSFTIVSQGKHIVSSFMCTVKYKQIIPAVVSRSSKEEKYLIKTTTNTFLFSYILSEIFNNYENNELQEYITINYPYLFI